MKYYYTCEACHEVFVIHATMAEKERGLDVRCPRCDSQQVEAGLGGTNGVGVLSRGTGGCCGGKRL